MKAKGSLYEVLKAATAGPAATPGTGPSAPPEPPPSSSDGSRPQTLKERLAAYKAKKLAAINQVVADATPPPATAAAPVPEAPEPAPEPAAPSFMAPTILGSPPPEDTEPEPAPPPPAPEPSEPEAEPAPPEAEEPEAAPSQATPSQAAPKRGPGERVVRLTYNTAAFAALVVVGMVFLAYALGVQAGRAKANAPVATAPPAAAGPAAPVKHYSLLLADWPTSGARDRLQAQYAADQLSRAVRRAGLGKPRIETLQRGNQAYLVLYMGETTDPLSDENRKKLSLLRRMKVGDTLPFQKAGFEERPRK